MSDTDVVARARALVGGVAVPAEVRAAAVAALEAWWGDPELAAYRPAIRALVDGDRAEELVDAFRQVLPFGTGGRRGAVGVGPNRINPRTVGTSVQGHVDWLGARGELSRARSVGVVVAYDVRRFVDAGGRYTGAGATPIEGLTSRDLAELAARVYAANGVRVHLLPRGTTRYLSTPELSFTIRALGAAGGLNVSASHNPPDDNGVKVYDARGGQLAPPEDQELLDIVARVAEARTLTWEAALPSFTWLTDEMHARYVAAVAGVVAPGPRTLGVLYTPLHGTGVVHEALAHAGFTCALHGAQATPDGAFPTVPGGVANPEAPAAMASALAAAEPSVDLVFGTDPDADRLGCEVRHGHDGTGWVHLTGNDIAALVVHAVVRPQVDGRTPLVVVTEVTSSLVGRVARAAGAAVVDDLLVGFKYVAAALATLETAGAWHGLQAASVRYVAGAEESHGVLVTDQIRDKDAASGAVVLAALAAAEKECGRTLVDVLDELRDRHGYVVNTQVSLAYTGATGPDRLARLLDSLRTSPPTSLADRPVTAAIDHRDPTGRFGPFCSESDRAARNVLVYALGAGTHDDGARVILRPSGTEPKLKVYVEVLGRPHLDAAGRRAVDAAADALGTALRTRLA